MSGLAGIQTQGERTLLSLLQRPFPQEMEASWNKHLRLAFARTGSTAIQLPIKFMCAIWISNCNILASSASDFICLSSPFLRQRQFACNVFSMKTENGMMRCGNKTIFRLMPFLQKKEIHFSSKILCEAFEQRRVWVFCRGVIGRVTKIFRRSCWDVAVGWLLSQNSGSARYKLHLILINCCNGFCDRRIFRRPWLSICKSVFRTLTTSSHFVSTT